jgi:phosphoserine phosphatase
MAGCGGRSIDGAWFYSDSHNDLPLLEVVANPVAVDPDPTLEATAANAAGR